MTIDETIDKLKAEFREWYTIDKGYPQQAFTEFLILRIHELERVHVS